MRRLVLTFASTAYEAQWQVFRRSLARHSPDLEIRAIRRLESYTAILAARPGEVLKALTEGYDQVILAGVDNVFFSPPDFPAEPTCILFPNFLTPPPHDGRSPNIHDYLRTGTFSSDLQVWNNTGEARDFLSWYSSELARECVCDFSKGLFFDQTYLNLAGGLRGARIDSSGEHNRAFYNVEGNTSPKAFKSFHFTGFDPQNPASISRHQNRLRASGDLLDLMERYAADLRGDARSAELPERAL